jgi:hypothetical protein
MTNEYVKPEMKILEMNSQALLAGSGEEDDPWWVPPEEKEGCETPWWCP